jgi:hypothetical protein
MPSLPLYGGQTALVDQDDYDRLHAFKWYYRPERSGNQGCAMRHVRNAAGKVTTQYLSRDVMNPPPGMEIIFLNHDRLDCRKENLKVVDRAHAQRHKRARSDNPTGHKGIIFNPGPKTFSVNLWRDGRMKRVGTFESIHHAKEAYERAVRLYEDAEAHQKAESDSTTAV